MLMSQAGVARHRRSVATLDVLVEFGRFVLRRDEPGGELVATLPQPDDPELIVQAGAGGIAFNSAQNDHYASLRIEINEGPLPPENDRGWDVTNELVLDLDSGGTLRLVLEESSGYSGPFMIQLREPQRVRVRCKGRRQIQEHGEASFAWGVEQWLVELAPLTSVCSA